MTFDHWFFITLFFTCVLWFGLGMLVEAWLLDHKAAKKSAKGKHAGVPEAKLL